MGGIKSIILALLSIIVGFAISFFTLNAYLKGNLKNEEPTAIKKEVKKPNKKVAKKQTEAPIEVEAPTTKKTDKAINIADIQESYNNWNTYHKNNIDLMSTFIPVDNNEAIMDKRVFLVSLRTGAYVAVKSENKKGETQYSLVNLKEDADEKIKKSIVSKATIAYQYFKMEGKKLPSYDFVDLKGKSHNKVDTEGKILVLKCWFITCKVCVEEFPQLNALVDKYKDDNIEFVSLAFDEKNELIDFLKTKPFKYVTVPNQKKYMSKKLKVKQYPTHLIVSEDGVILKMVNNVKTLTSELKIIIGK
ncbi:TlpA family protein disulfide reductase [Tenacibaculum insulae]|uniref:TlpA family protein disulfide reductase n=1 Tax=Tenacibaculum insulae TaxID=2029677 RepID=UPI003AB40809